MEIWNLRGEGQEAQGMHEQEHINATPHPPSSFQFLALQGTTKNFFGDAQF